MWLLFSMKKEYRIRKNEEFSSIIALKKSCTCKSFVMCYAPRKLDHVRVGISVSKKLGDAVERNKIKRQVRMMILNVIDFENYPFDIIVIVRNQYLSNEFADNQSDLEKLSKKAII